jgi:hypothetical protein
MAEIFRSRQCVALFKGDSQPVVVSPAMVAGGWVGGQAVMWTKNSADEVMVTYAQGLYGGFLLFGSDEPGDDYTAMTRSQPTYRYATFGSGGWLISTIAYETYTYASRIGGGPLVPLTYTMNQPLYFSLRGLWTNEDELTLTASPLAPAFFTGFVAQMPKPSNKSYLGIQTSL